MESSFSRFRESPLDEHVTPEDGSVNLMIESREKPQLRLDSIVTVTLGGSGDLDQMALNARDRRVDLCDVTEDGSYCRGRDRLTQTFRCGAKHRRPRLSSRARIELEQGTHDKLAELPIART